jgi:hypothetical protein
MLLCSCPDASAGIDRDFGPYIVVITDRREGDMSSLQNHNEEQLVATDIKAMCSHYHISPQLLAQCHATWLGNPFPMQAHAKVGTQRTLQLSSGLRRADE